MTSPSILVFAGSIRTGAYSGKVAALAAKELAIAGADVTHISLADYPLPIYDADLEKEKGIPENARKLARQIAAHDGVFVATPEYNRSLPPLLKNALDWVSRIRSAEKIAYRHRIYAIAGSSNGRFGGARAVIELRKVLAAAVSGIVIPEQFEASNAGDAFNESGELVDESVARALRHVVAALLETVRRTGA